MANRNEIQKKLWNALKKATGLEIVGGPDLMKLIEAFFSTTSANRGPVAFTIQPMVTWDKNHSTPIMSKSGGTDKYNMLVYVTQLGHILSGDRCFNVWGVDDESRLVYLVYDAVLQKGTVVSFDGELCHLARPLSVLSEEDLLDIQKRGFVLPTYPPAYYPDGGAFDVDAWMTGAVEALVRGDTTYEALGIADDSEEISLEYMQTSEDSGGVENGTDAGEENQEEPENLSSTLTEEEVDGLLNGFEPDGGNQAEEEQPAEEESEAQVTNEEESEAQPEATQQNNVQPGKVPVRQVIQNGGMNTGRQGSGRQGYRGGSGRNPQTGRSGIGGR